jgi:hypothetical protein
VILEAIDKKQRKEMTESGFEISVPNLSVQAASLNRQKLLTKKGSSMSNNFYLAFFFCMSFLINVPAYAHGVSICNIPEIISQKVETAYLGYEVVKPKHLKKDDLKMFKKDHGNNCPGFIKVDFFGTGEPTYALLLRNKQKKINYKLIVITKNKIRDDWEIIELGEKIDDASVIWKEPPGEYEGVLDGKKIKAKYPVIILVGYESWAIVFSWTGHDVVKVWVSD